MNGFLLGSTAMGILGLVGYTFSPNESAEFRDLTNDTQALLEKVADSHDPPAPSGSLMPPYKDLLAIYLNSRGNRDWVNQQRIKYGTRKYEILLQTVEKDHRAIKRLASACVGDKLLDKIDSNHRSTRYERLLWLYADEQGVLSQIAEFCSPHDREFISTRV